MSRQRILYGKIGEDFAVRRLRKKGYRLIERNYRTRFGEIDIIAQHQKTIVFIEVKTRSSRKFGPPQAAVTPGKQRKLSKVALAYLQATGQLEAKARFDVVAIRAQDAKPSIEIFQNAFELAYP
jgi:putative endonuclease